MDEFVAIDDIPETEGEHSGYVVALDGWEKAIRDYAAHLRRLEELRDTLAGAESRRQAAIVRAEEEYNSLAQQVQLTYRSEGRQVEILDFQLQQHYAEQIAVRAKFLGEGRE